MYRQEYSRGRFKSAMFGALETAWHFSHARRDPQRASLPAAELQDSEIISQAAAVTGVSEFDLFQAAWRQWHGKAAQERLIERVFVDYLRKGRAPTYARHFARRVLEAARAGQLDLAALGLSGFTIHEAIPDLSCHLTAEVLFCGLNGFLAILL